MRTVHAYVEPEPTAGQLRDYRFAWPSTPLSDDDRWSSTACDNYFARVMPESDEEFALDSQWPAFFPASICVISASDGHRTALEREVGAAIVNRFPYVLAVSICRDALSGRHHPRHRFIDVLTSGGSAAIQFLEPGPNLDATLRVMAEVPEGASDRIERTGLSSREAITNSAPVFDSAYLIYEATLVKPQRDFHSVPIYDEPWVDVGSHRVFFLEINAIALRADIADGDSQIRWRSLPAWRPTRPDPEPEIGAVVSAKGYQKGYTPRYAFPSSTTTAFEYDEVIRGRAVKYLPPLAVDQVEVDNDRARWPCFYPSSAGLITSWADDGTPAFMPCGSTNVVSRHPFTIAPCITYVQINERYARRRSLDVIRASGRFGVGVPHISKPVVDAVKYAGNVSLTQDPDKLRNSGLHLGTQSAYGPVLLESPIHYDCEVVDELMLGTHMMLLGEVRRILVRSDVTPDNPLEWYPWAAVTSAGMPAPV
ncbi:MAG: flavin reductase [Alphaproteobacteria bacterium]|nr:flavin reductase [Alphaproteobacteria bacterium]